MQSKLKADESKSKRTMAKKDGKELTPMMKQFFDFKAKYPEAVLLFRCGDFYETYCEDAVIASQILGITLTHRNNGYNKGDDLWQREPSRPGCMEGCDR